METLTANRAGGFSLVVGSLVSILFFLLQPAGLLIDPVDAGDATGTVQAYMDNPEMTKLTSAVIAVGLTMMVYGMIAVWSGMRDSGKPEALLRYGVLFLLIGATGWILAQGLHFALADTDPNDISSGLATYAVDSGVTHVGGIAVSIGFLLLGLGSRAKGGAHRPIGLVIAAISAISLVSLFVGIMIPDDYLVIAVRISRACYFPWVAWAVWLGVGMLREQAEA